MTDLLSDPIVLILGGGIAALLAFLGWGGYKEAQGRRQAEREQLADQIKHDAAVVAEEDRAALEARAARRAEDIPTIPPGGTDADRVLGELRKKRSARGEQ